MRKREGHPLDPFEVRAPEAVAIPPPKKIFLDSNAQ